MAQSGKGLLTLPFLRRYQPGRDDALQDMKSIAEVAGRNNKGLFRSLRSAQNYFEGAIDIEGMPRKKLSDKHFKRGSIYGRCLERGMKNFVTDLMVGMTWNTPNSTIVWSQNGATGPLQNAIIYWPDNEYTSLITAGTAVISNTKLAYFYIDPRNHDYSITKDDSVNAIKNAQADGKICLWRVRPDRVGRNIGWRHVGWGGGRDLK